MARNTTLRIAAATLLAGVAFTGAAKAGDYSNASTYNAPFGMNAGQENAPPNTSLRAATAIGNQLNVVTLGNNNTVVVNATQTNNGNQTATNSVNGH